MSDLDDELLALAGDDDASGEEDTTVAEPAAQVSKEPTPPKSLPSSQEEMPPASARRGVAQKKTAKAVRRAPAATSRKRAELEDNLGQTGTVESDLDSLGSGAMDESDSDAPNGDFQATTGDVDVEALYPVDGAFRSDRDRAEIMALPEIRREEILAERAQEVERHTQDLHLKRLLQAREQGDAKPVAKNKRKAGVADLEDGERRTTRQKVVKGSDKLEAYKQQRAQRGEQRKGVEDRKRDQRSPSAEGKRSDVDAEGESEVEWDDRKPAAPQRDEAPADLKDYDRVRVGRTNFARVCFYPGFEDTMKGCFVRVSIGIEKATGNNVYRVAQIKSINEGKCYIVEGPNGKPVATNQYVLVAHGKSEKEWPFLSISDSRFTEAELDRYKRTIAADGLRLPSKIQLIRKLDEIHALINRRWTDAEIQEKVKRAANLQVELYNGGAERARLKEQRRSAVEAGNEAAIAKIDAELAALDGGAQKLAYGSSPAKPSPAAKAPTQQERLAALNRANRKANAEEIRKAQIAERRAEQRAQAAVARGEAVANPFARVKTRAKVMHDESEKKVGAVASGRKEVDDLFGEVASGTDVSKAATPAASGISTPKTRATGGERKGVLGGLKKKKKNMDDDLIAAMDLGIEIDI